jgi:hypothetical protein
LDILFWLPCSGYPVPDVLFWLSTPLLCKYIYIWSMSTKETESAKVQEQKIRSAGAKAKGKSAKFKVQKMATAQAGERFYPGAQECASTKTKKSGRPALWMSGI